MPLRRARRFLLAFAIAPLLLGALGGCGRKGPLELPADVQAAREAQAAQQQAEAAAKAKAQGGEQKPKLSEQEAKPELKPVPGEKGNRPPQDYPFPLDFLL